MHRPTNRVAAFKEGATIIIETIIGVLFKAENRRVQSWIDRISDRNRDLQKITEPVGFLHEGQIYKPSAQGKGAWAVKLIHHSLVHEMDQLLKSKVSTDRDKQQIRQMLFALLKDCNSEQEIRDALPECIIDTVPQLTKLERQAEPAWTIENDVRATATYAKVLPKLELYAATRFIY